MRRVLLALAALLFALPAVAQQTQIQGGGGGGSGCTVSGSAGQLVYNSGSSGCSSSSATITSGGALTLPAAGAASAPGLLVSGAAFTGGSGTTTFPQLLVQDSAATASSTWSTTGTTIGGNAHTGIGNLIDLQKDGVSKFSVNTNGNGIFGGNLTTNGNISTSGAGNVSIGASNTFNFNSATILSSPASAQLQLGAADAAAPVAQTLSAQNVSTGTSNTAGVNLTINGPRGTGTGGSGSIIFQTGVTGSTGSTQNTLATALTLTNKQALQLGIAGTCTTAALAQSAGTNDGFVFLNGTASLAYTNGGACEFAVSNTGVISSGYLAFVNGTWTSAPTPDLYLTRQGAASLRLGTTDAATPVAQTLGVQSVAAGTSNTAGAGWTITGSQSTGSGASGDIIFQTGGTGAAATTQNTLTTALTIKGATQAIQMPGLASSSSAQTGTVCWTTSTGNLTVDTTTTCLLSDMRLKKNMAPLSASEGLKEVMALKPFSYDLKSDPMHAGRQVGLGAQDVQKVDPRLVALYDRGPDAGTPKGVRYEQLTAVLVKAVQQEQAEIETLKAELAAYRRTGTDR